MKNALAWSLLALAAFAAFAAQPWLEDYERGLAAIAASDWTKVAVAMQSAAKQNPNEAVALKLRRRTVAYLPWYWLGVAQLETGDAAGALQSLRASAKQGVIDKTPLYGDFRKALSRAEAAAASPRSARASAAVATYQDAVKAAVASQGKAMLAGSTRSETYRKATLKLQEARERARSERGEDLAEGTKLATQAEEMFRRAATEQASARKTSKTVRATMQPQVPAQAVPAPAEPTPAETASAEVLAEIEVPMAEPANAAPELAAPPPEVTPPAAPAPSPRLVKSTESMLRTLRNQASAEAVRRDPRVLTSRDLDQIEMRLLAAANDAEVGIIRGEIARELDALRSITAATPASRPATGGPPAAVLERAYRALAEGRPEESERILTDLLAGTESAEGLLLRGCARYTLGTLTRRTDLLDSARDDLARALRINPRLQLDARYFSPKLVELLAEVRKGETEQSR